MQLRPYRSLLFVPGTKPDWMARATRFGADAYILDLEDAVPEAAKTDVRGAVATAIPGLAAQDVGVFVRINGLDTPHWLRDIEAVLVRGLTGIALPKVSQPADVATLDHVLSVLEAERGLPEGDVDVQPLLETARGIADARGILSASPRVRSFFGGAARDGDVSREIGFRWTSSAAETLYIRSKLLVDARAAGVPYPVSGTWVDVQDSDGFEAFARANRDLGYSGIYAIHPSQVAPANAIFGLDSSEVEYFQRVIAAVEDAERLGDGALLLDGVMIDNAMVVRARAVLAAARSQA